MMNRILIALAILFALAGAHAEERILDYDVQVAIQQDGALDVTERITVRAEGNNIRRGIYRDFPTRYRDRYGNRVVVDLDVLSVERNGETEPWFTENVENGVRINTGDDDFLPTPGEFTYTLRYRTTRQPGFFADHDELYWNAIGTGWVFPIDAATVEATLPVRVPASQLSAEGYTGPQGAQGADYAAEIAADGVARWRITRPLAPYEGFTIVLSFPKGVIAQPSDARRAWWLFKDNLGVLAAVAGLAVLIFYCFREWRRVGRDPDQGVIIARYEPPAGHTPAALRYLRRMSYDTRCFSSDLLALAVAGCVRIDRDKGFFKDDWSLERIDAKVMPDSQQTLLARLFQTKQKLELTKSNATTLAAATNAHSKALDKALQPRYFNRNSASFLKALGIAVVAIAAGFMIAAGASASASAIALIVVGALMALTLVIFANVVRAPTKEGRALLDEIEGLKLYLSVAERDELARMQGPGAPPPQLDAKRYETLLPFAVALEVEEAWTEKFTAAVGAAAAAAASQNIGWYRGGGVNDLGSLSRAIGGSLTSQIASSSTPPGSSSGRGGGGSSGGGGGGDGRGGKPILLLAHMDVVAAKREEWERDPYTLIEENGFFYGRGTLDNKQGVAILTSTFLRLKKEGFKPSRDLIIAFTGDEETGMLTTNDLAHERRALTDAEFALNSDDGGGALSDDGKALYLDIIGAEKISATFEMTVRNPGGHSSLPRADNAIYELADAVKAVQAYRFPVMTNDWTLGSFKAVGARTPGALGEAMTRFAANPQDEAAADVLFKSPSDVGKTRTTCVATKLQAGHASNALPQTATATINCRIFPGTPVSDVQATLQKLAGEKASVRTLDHTVPADASPLRKDVIGAVTKAAHAIHPGIPVVPGMAPWATDGSVFRAAGIPTYGVGASFIRPEDAFSHGLNERLPVQSFYDELAYWDVLLRELAGGKRR